MEIMIPTLTKDKKHKLYIFTDSIYSLKSFTEWGEKWEKNGAANTPLAFIHNVNFSIEDSSYDLEDVILKKFNTGEIDNRN